LNKHEAFFQMMDAKSWTKGKTMRKILAIFFLFEKFLMKRDES
jgi:hypothetical protein